MKAYLIDRLPGAPVAAPLPIRIVPASAFIPGGRPVYLPPIADVWEAEAYVALRVCRLGKGVAPQFAHRYYDAMAVAVRLVPSGLEEHCAAAGMPCGAAWTFDGALQLGGWTDLPGSDGVTLTLGDASVHLDAGLIDADNVVSVLSQYTGIKQGDIIAPVRLPVRLPVGQGTRFEARLGQSVLALRYK